MLGDKFSNKVKVKVKVKVEQNLSSMMKKSVTEWYSRWELRTNGMY